MKLQNNAQDLEIHGDEGTSSFSIALNGKAFRVLSDTLYQNKIGSIVREISCNAYDAHVSAGKADVPFEIHLPDAFEPWFSVKDYGIGLTHSAIKTVFTQYFNSTKENDNDAIGAFGLGAKTPFSYTDQFTVTSVVGGQKTIWTAYIGKSGVPDISVMHTEDSIEPTGVEIKMSVKREDFNTFAREVRDQLQYFKVKPSFTNSSVVFTTFSYMEETTDYRMHTGGSGISIIQGNVGYPLLINNLQGKISADMYGFVCHLAQKKIDLLFSIGEIGVTASREGVEYNATTIKNIESKLQIVMDQLKKDTQAELDALSTDWERSVYMHGKSGLHQSMFPNVKLGYPTASVTVNTTLRTTIGRFDRRDRFRKTLKSFPSNNIFAHKGLVVIYKDTPKSMTRKLNHLLATDITINEVYVYTSTEKSAADLSAALGGCPVIKASEIQLPKTLRANAGPTGPRKRYFELEDGEWEPKFEKLSEIDEEVVYMTVDRLADTEPVDYYYKILSDLQAVPTLIMIRESDLELVKSNPLFQPVDTYVNSQKSCYNMRMARVATVKQTMYSAFNSVDSSVRTKMKKVKELLPVNHPVKEFFDKLYTFNDFSDTLDASRAYKVATLIGKTNVANDRVTRAMKKRLERLEVRYPVLTWMKQWNFCSSVEEDQLVKTFVALSKL